jgi:Ca2+-binding RTX toxin-like protein
VIDAGAGNDSVLGGDGNDRVWAGAGDDSVDTGPGFDRVRGRRGDDTINGGDGFDVLHGGLGADTINGGPGNDRITARVREARSDTVNGDAGDDRIFTRDGTRDVVTCGAGVDRVRADFVDDVAADCEQVKRHTPRSAEIPTSE